MPWGLVLVALVGVSLVALAASDVQLKQPTVLLEGGWTWAVRVVGAVAAGAGMVVLLRQRRGHGPTGGLGSDPSVIAFRTAATIMIGLALVAPAARYADFAPPSFSAGGFGLIGIEPEFSEARSRDLTPVPGEENASLLRGERISGLTGEAVSSSGEDAGTSVARKAAGVLSWLLVLVLGLAVFRLLFRRQRRLAHERAIATPLEPLKAREAVQASLDEVLPFGRDPGCQITAAYLRLLEALSTAGVPKKSEEAPHEHLVRALGPLGVTPEPLHRLAGLYVLAQFGGHPVTPRHRAAAADALEASLDGLRSAHPPSVRPLRPPVEAGAVP